MVPFKDLRNGDLLVWEDPPENSSKVSFSKFVRLLTISNFGHVSVVVVNKDFFGHIEATIPVIHISEIPKTGTAYVIPMGLDLSFDDVMVFFKDKLGLKYGFGDAIRAWFGFTLKDENKWQCAELCLFFYRSLGLVIPDAFTPKDLVRELMFTLKKPLARLDNS